MPRVSLTLAAIAACLLVLAACDSGEDPPPAPPPETSATTAPGAVTIDPPAEQDDALSEAGFPPGAVDAAYFALDLESGLVQRIRAEGGTARWASDDTLLVTIDEDAYEVALDGAVTAALPPPPPASDLTTSADGAWRAASTAIEGAFPAIEVRPEGASAPTHRVSNTAPFAWAPAGAMLALVGNPCLDFDLFVFEPAAASLQNLTADFEPAVLDLLWSPDASQIAVFALPLNDRRLIAFAQADGSGVETIVQMQGTGELHPIAFNPSGTMLLFLGLRTGRGYCEDGQAGAETALEVLS